MEDSIMILTTKIIFVNNINYNRFVYLISFNIEKPETYVQAISSSHAI